MTDRFITILILSTFVVLIGTATLDCDDGCKASGTTYNLTCTSTSSGGCDWYRGTTRLISCPEGGICTSDVSGYSGIRISNTHYVLQIESLTAETLECRLGSETAVRCAITLETDVPTGTLTATCESDLITCSGITNHGTPPVAIELKKGSTVLSSTTTGGSVNTTQENSAGTKYTCAVTGNLANCLSLESIDVTCPVVPTPGPTTPVTSTTTQQTQQTQSPHPTDIPGSGDVCYIILAVAVACLLLILIILLVTYLVKREWFRCALIVLGVIAIIVGIICTAVYFAVCQSDTPMGMASAAFSIIVFIVGVILIVIGVCYLKSSEKQEEKPEEKPVEKPEERPNKPI